jgi:pilus assembly protein FimV
VGRAITVAILAAALALAAPLFAHAAGLGRLTVFSPLGQPLNAEIEIVALRPGEEEGLLARLAPMEAFAAAGIEPSSAIVGMRFTVERRDGRRFLRLTTPQPVNDPFIELLVELQWATGKLVREYTFLLDPPEYKAPQTIAAMQPPAAPAKPAAEVAKPVPAIEPKPLEAAAPPVITAAPDTPAATAPAAPAETPAAPAATPAAPVTAVPLAPAPAETRAAPEAPAASAAAPAAPAALPEPIVYEVKKGDTLGAIAKQNLPPGVSLNQMLIAIYRANQDAFIRENINLVRAGRILNIPTADDIGTVDAAEANRVVRAHMAEFREYRTRLAAVPSTAEAAPGQREAAGRIEPRPEAAAKPPAPQDQVRLSKADPQKPGAGQAARGDDLVARERALKEAQSRVSDLEKNVADLQKLLELKNRQFAELEKKAAAKPAAPAAPAPAPAAPAAKAPEAPKPVAEAPKPAAPGPAPAAKAPEAPKPVAEAPKPAAAAPKPAAAAPKPAAKLAPLPPAPSAVDEILEFVSMPLGWAVIGVLIFGFGGYGYYAWRKKKAVQSKFHDNVMGAAAAGAAASAEPTLGAATPPAGPSQLQPASGAPAGMAAEEVDPIAEADVYMAYGRDAQAEEILKEALQNDASRVAVHAKLLEIYANRKDAKAFEQAALKLKNLTNGAGPDWEKAAGLGRSIDPQNDIYGTGEPAPAAAAAAAPAPTLDFDVGGGAQASASAPDLTLDAAPKPAADAGLDFDVGGAPAKADVSSDETVVVPSSQDRGAAVDFDLFLGSPAEPKAEPAVTASAAAPADSGLSFDINFDLGGGDKKAEAAPAAAPDLSTISLDLGASAPVAAAGTDPKWQEVATKLDLAKAYDEMGDKNGARELLSEVMKDGDAAQKGQAQQLLAKLG